MHFSQSELFKIYLPPLIFLSFDLIIWNSGLASGFSAQHSFMQFITHSSAVSVLRSLTLGRNTSSPGKENLFTRSIISVILFLVLNYLRPKTIFY